ncbi:MAG: hypothetical protein ACYC2U_08610, partial [Candidatus Amoebophilus sp.]
SSEAMNYVGLNLAHEIITCQRDVSNARDMYNTIAKEYAQGNISNYAQGLLFVPESDYVGDADFDFRVTEFKKEDK